MSEPDPIPTDPPLPPVLPVVDIVVEALNAELRRIRNKLEGANQRLSFAASNMAAETALITELGRDIALLVKAIRDHGGVAEEPEDPPAITPPDEPSSDVTP